MNQKSRQSTRRSWLLIGGVVGVILASLIVWFVMQRSPSPATHLQTGSDLFYKMLVKASQQSRFGISMYRTTYATKTDADARHNKGSELSSVSELDTASREYRSVFAHNLFDKPKFDIGRCIKNDTYNDNYQNAAERPDTLTAANEALKTRVYKVTQALVFIPCPYLGIIPQGSADLAVARLSDGVFPVTLSPQQAKNWGAQVSKAQLFEVKDEGAQTYNGKQVRKLSFTPKGDKVNQRLYDAFYQAAEIDTVKHDHPDAPWQFAFITLNPRNTGSVGGYYLIDEQTELPVYSELYGTNPDRQPESNESAGRNIARTKQRYYYPNVLTITTQTPLEILE
jgi:hypothetical protein